MATNPSEVEIAGYLFPAVVIVDPATGKPVPVTDVIPTSGEVTIAGDVSIAGTVPVSVAAPVPIAGTVPVSVAAPVPIAGTVPVSVAAPAPVNITTPAPISVAGTPTMPASLVDPITGVLTSAIRDYLVEVGFRSNVSAYAGHRRIVALGNNPSIDIATEPEDIWSGGGAYPWMTAATALELVSSSASDTAAGTGARTVTVIGLLADFTELTQVVALNGVTPVAVPTSLFRVNTFLMASAGSAGINAGDILIRDAGAGTTRAVIPAGYGNARQSVFTVPAGNTLQIISQVFSINRSGGGTERYATLQTFIRNAVTGMYRLPFEVSVSDQFPYRHDGAPGITLTEKTDFCHRCAVVNVNATNVTAGWLGVMRLNTLT